MKKNNAKVKKYLNIINKIEKVRSKNNVNWIDVLRLALKNHDANEGINWTVLEYWISHVKEEANESI